MEDAAARRERLKKISAGASLKFRNYKPQDTELKTKEVAVALPQPILDEVAKKKPEGRNELDGAPAAKKAKTDEQESAIQKELRQHNDEHGGAEMLNIAPRKPNWDLKRDVAKKMEKLTRRTQLAIVELIKERIEKEAAEASDDEEE